MFTHTCSHTHARWYEHTHANAYACTHTRTHACTLMQYRHMLRYRNPDTDTDPEIMANILFPLTHTKNDATH